jgi:hypothetical protein
MSQAIRVPLARSHHESTIRVLDAKHQFLCGVEGTQVLGGAGPFVLADVAGRSRREKEDGVAEPGIGLEDRHRHIAAGGEDLLPENAEERGLSRLRRTPRQEPAGAGHCCQRDELACCSC